FPDCRYESHSTRVTLPSSLKLQAALAGRLGERLHAPMVFVWSAVENDLLDSLLDGPCSQRLPDLGRCRLVAGVLARAKEGLLRRAGRHQRPPRRVVD